LQGSSQADLRNTRVMESRAAAWRADSATRRLARARSKRDILFIGQVLSGQGCKQVPTRMQSVEVGEDVGHFDQIAGGRTGRQGSDAVVAGAAKQVLIDHFYNSLVVEFS